MRITLRRREHAGPRGYLYDAVLDGEIIASSRDPEFAACRALVRRGYRGRVDFWREGASHPSMTIMSIERAAGLSTSESAKAGLRIGKHTPLKERPAAVAGSGARTGEANRGATLLPAGANGLPGIVLP